MDQKKNDETLKILLQIAEHCEALSKEIRAAVARIIEERAKKMEQWQILRAPRPVDENDRAITWLGRRLEEIRKAHPNIRYEFEKDDAGLIIGLKYFAESEEEQADIEAPARWAFSKAAERPSLGERQGGASNSRGGSGT